MVHYRWHIRCCCWRYDDIDGTYCIGLLWLHSMMILVLSRPVWWHCRWYSILPPFLLYGIFVQRPLTVFFFPTLYRTELCIFVDLMMTPALAIYLILCMMTRTWCTWWRISDYGINEGEIIDVDRSVTRFITLMMMLFALLLRAAAAPHCIDDICCCYIFTHVVTLVMLMMFLMSYCVLFGDFYTFSVGMPYYWYYCGRRITPHFGILQWCRISRQLLCVMWCIALKCYDETHCMMMVWYDDGDNRIYSARKFQWIIACLRCFVHVFTRKWYCQCRTARSVAEVLLHPCALPPLRGDPIRVDDDVRIWWYCWCPNVVPAPRTAFTHHWPSMVMMSIWLFVGLRAHRTISGPAQYFLFACVVVMLILGTVVFSDIDGPCVC